jgi:hypothetical protein
MGKVTKKTEQVIENNSDGKAEQPIANRSTAAEAAAGAANLANWQAEHGTRSAMTKHGIATWRTFGVLPPSAAHLAPILSDFQDGLIADLGGEENLTTGQRGLIAAQHITLGTILLASEHLSKEGLHTKRGKLQPVLAMLATYLNTFRLNADKLGLARVPRQIESLESVAREYAEKKQGNEAENQN